MPGSIDSTPYDSAFRTMAEKASPLLVALVNEFFQTGYPDDAHVEVLHDKHHVWDKDAKEMREIETDANFLIDGHRYHIECQSTRDRRISIRMLEYDFHIALDSAEKQILRFPRSGIVNLRQGKCAVEGESIEIIFPDGQRVTYRVPAINVKHYTKEMIFKKRLLILLPFYLFRYEGQFGKFAEDAAARAALLQELQEIEEHLEKLSETGKIDDITQSLVTEMMQYVNSHLLAKQLQLKQEVTSNMGGKLLETKTFKMIDAAKAEGKAEGEIAGTITTYAEFNLSAEQISKKLMEKFNLGKEKADAYVTRFLPQPAAIG